MHGHRDCLQMQSVSSRPPTPKKKVARDSGFLNAENLAFGKSLGTGGFGAVYHGTYLGEDVAIKRMHPPDTGPITDEQLVEFSKEVIILQSLKNERLVRFIGVALVPHTIPFICIVTEFMAAGSLFGLLFEKEHAFTRQQRFTIAQQVTEGIVYLHTQNPPFVHRDVKSLNVVMDLSNGISSKLCDFGLTQTMEKTHISRREKESGSPRYMAPELFHSNGKLTEKIDVWALGCLIMEVCTNRCPLEDCQSVRQVMERTLVERQWPYLDFRGEAAKLRVLAERCFEFHPSARAPAVDILEELKAIASP